MGHTRRLDTLTARSSESFRLITWCSCTLPTENYQCHRQLYDQLTSVTEKTTTTAACLSCPLTSPNNTDNWAHWQSTIRVMLDNMETTHRQTDRHTARQTPTEDEEYNTIDERPSMCQPVRLWNTGVISTNITIWNGCKTVLKLPTIHILNASSKIIFSHIRSIFPPTNCQHLQGYNLPELLAHCTTVELFTLRRSLSLLYMISTTNIPSSYLSHIIA